MSEENKALKASGATVAAAAPADNSAAMESVEKIARLCAALSAENAALKAKLSE